MHELSIAMSIGEMTTEEAARHGVDRGARPHTNSAKTGADMFEWLPFVEARKLARLVSET